MASGKEQLSELPVQTGEELMQLVAAGDRKAFDEVYDRYHRQMYNFIKKQVVQRAAAEDITQEVFVRLFKAARRFDPDKQLTSYLYKIAVNEIRRHYQKASSTQAFSLNEPLAAEDDGRERIDLMSDERQMPEAQVQEEFARRTLRQLIDRLPPEQKMVVLLKVYDELTFEEIAQIMDRPLSTVLSRMRYALQKLRRWMDDEGITQNELPGS
jgi:RNA polymerase sigma factor (sigma-70 family)